MSEPSSIEQELARLRSENARLRFALESQGPGVRVIPLAPEIRAVMPNAEELRALLAAINAHWPNDFSAVAPGEFGRGFEVLAAFHRTAEPDATRYAFHWLGIANARLQMRNQREISLLAFTAAACAWSDIPLTRWDLQNEGFLQEFGLSEFHGRLPRDEWQRTLRREFCTPVDRRPRRRMSDNAPRPSILVDGKPLPSYVHYQGPRYTDF